LFLIPFFAGFLFFREKHPNSQANKDQPRQFFLPVPEAFIVLKDRPERPCQHSHYHQDYRALGSKPGSQECDLFPEIG
jgi:hypothetical protein